MTFREFYDEAERRLPGAFEVEAKVWNFRHPGGQPEITYRIWSAERKEDWYGPTPELALLRLDEALHPPVPTFPDVSADAFAVTP